MLNFKGNHRKIFMADQEENAALIITSGNPHDGSSAHSNVALKITDTLCQDVYGAEAAVASFSGHKVQVLPQGLDRNIISEAEHAKIVFLTESFCFT